MKHIVGLLACLLITGTSWAQDIDENRMNRDIKIAQDIISGLISQESNSGYSYGGAKVNGNYIPDYGVILNIPLKNGLWPLGFKIWDDEEGQIVISDKVKDKGDALTMYHGGDFSEIMEARDDYLQDVMETFLVDYADLIGQLRPSDKIMLKSEHKQSGTFMIGGGKKYSFSWRGGDNRDYKDEDENDEDNGAEAELEEDFEDYGGDYVLSAEVLKADLTAFKSGKIDRNALMDRIQMDKTEALSQKEPELELLSTIFHRLYKSDLSDTYFATRAPEYDRIVKFGVIYKWRVYSSNIDGDRHNMPTVDAYNLTSEERNRRVEEIYPKFKEQLRQNLVEYGRTLKGLESDDILMFKIKMTECKGCTIPKSLDVSVKRSVLDDYEKQKIDLKAAANRVTVKENMAE